MLPTKRIDNLHDGIELGGGTKKRPIMDKFDNPLVANSNKRQLEEDEEVFE